MSRYIRCKRYYGYGIGNTGAESRLFFGPLDWGAPFLQSARRPAWTFKETAQVLADPGYGQAAVPHVLRLQFHVWALTEDLNVVSF